MIEANLLKMLGFKTNEFNQFMFLNFRGYKISYFFYNKKLYLLKKESTSKGEYISEINLQNCKNKKTRLVWLLLQELIRLNDYTDFGKYYTYEIQSLLVQMILSNTYKIDVSRHTSGNQFEMAKSRYLKIKSEVKKDV